jgi:hypothetical protein
MLFTEVTVLKAGAKLATFLLCLSLIVLQHQSAVSAVPAKPEASKEKLEYYATDEEGTEYFYDRGSVRRLKGNRVRVRVKAIYSEKNPAYSEVKAEWEIDCADRKLRGVSAKAKKKDGSLSTTTKLSDWSPIPSESTAETLLETVCPKKESRTP